VQAGGFGGKAGPNGLLTKSPERYQHPIGFVPTTSGVPNKGKGPVQPEMVKPDADPQSDPSTANAKGQVVQQHTQHHPVPTQHFQNTSQSQFQHPPQS